MCRKEAGALDNCPGFDDKKGCCQAPAVIDLYSLLPSVVWLAARTDSGLAIYVYIYIYIYIIHIYIYVYIICAYKYIYVYVYTYMYYVYDYDTGVPRVAPPRV